jgi:hypothetical protein
MESLKQVLMRRDELTSEEADELIADAKIALQGYIEDDDLESAENVCEEFFGLEPDYLMELY